MAVIYYKFKSAKDFDSIPIGGHFISVASFKRLIFAKHLKKGKDFDIVISNAQTNEDFVDEAAVISKHMSVLIRRVPGLPRKPIVIEPEKSKDDDNKAEELPPPSSMLVSESSTMKYPEESDWNEFVNDLNSIPEVLPTRLSKPVDVSASSKIEEAEKIKALVETPSLDWNRHEQDSYVGGRGSGRGMGAKLMSADGFGRGGFERRTLPTGYVCHRCRVPGHFIQHCPTNGDPDYDFKRMKLPTGIPRSMLMETSDGSYALANGAAAILKPNEAAFEKEIEGLPSTRHVSDLPPDLRCPVCNEVMKDAVLTGKCCFRSFCDKCIREYIINKQMCPCGATNVLSDDLLPNKTLRDTISRILQSPTSSTENVGSLVLVQDMESAHHVHPQGSSPTQSAASKDECMPPLVDHSSDLKEGNSGAGEDASEGKVVINDETYYLEKKTTKDTDAYEATPEATGPRETISLESARMPAEIQEKLLGCEQGKKKKKKTTHLPESAADLGAEAYARMPLVPSTFNPYWGGGMPVGVDGCMARFGAGFPFMGCPSGPDVTFDGMLPLDPFASQYYMMSDVLPRDLSELTINSMGMNQGHPVSRDEFEAWKADVKRQRKNERHDEREHSKDSRGPGREVSSSGANGSSLKAKPRLMPKAASENRFNKPDRTKKATNIDHRDRRVTNLNRHSHCPSPQRLTKQRRRRSSDDHDDKSDRKNEGNESSNRKRKCSSSYKDEEEEDYHFKRRSLSSKRREEGWMAREQDRAHRHKIAA